MSRAFTVHDVQQGTPEWLQLRAGRLCASQAAAMLDMTQKGLPGYKRRDLFAKLCAERLTGKPSEEGYVSPEMQRGKDLEADALAAYEFATGTPVARIGFISHNTLPIGYSPDGAMGDFDGLLELKVPKAATHMRYLDEGLLPADYRGQCLHALWVTGAPFIDFASYGPDFPERLQLFTVRLARCPAVDIEIASYAACAEKFLAEIDQKVERLRGVVVAA